ncbi:MAG: hypothetical protein WDZ90_02485 [Candidatus Paceibacterota bacterium]
MTVDQLDVRQSVLRKTFGKKKALACIEEALSRNKGEIKPHSRALLLLGKIELSGTFSPTLAEEIRSVASKISKENPRQAVRLFRGLGRLWMKWQCAGCPVTAVNDPRSHFMIGYKLALQAGADDQIKKIKAEARSVGILLQV